MPGAAHSGPTSGGREGAGVHGLTAAELAARLLVPEWRTEAACRALLWELAEAGLVVRLEAGGFALSEEAERRFGPSLRQMRKERD